MKYVVMTEAEWQKKNPGLRHYVHKRRSTPYPFEQKSAHYQWLNSPSWRLCHGYVHGKPHAWVELRGVVIDFMVPRGETLIKRSRKKFLLAIHEALKYVKGYKDQQTIWERYLEGFSHEKAIFYRTFKPTKVKKYNRKTMCEMLDHYGRYGNWEGAPSPFAGAI